MCYRPGRGDNVARIRTIKPDFFTSEDVVSLTPLARLLFIATWLEADREGRLIWRTKTLKLRYLPGDDCSIEILADELVRQGLIVVYEVDGQVELIAEALAEAKNAASAAVAGLNLEQIAREAAGRC